VEHSAEDHIRLKPPYQLKQLDGSGAHARNAKGMNLDPGRHGLRAGVVLGDQPQMHLVLLAGEAPRQQGNHLLGAAAAKMWDEQENPGTLS
jgi:hypothetical protein